MAIGQTVPKIWRFFDTFIMVTVRHLGVVTGTLGQPTKSKMVVFSTVQNFVVIDAVVLIICKCWYLSSLA